jgi:hypothetical protein
MKKEYNVPVDSIIEFAEIIAENELDNEILGTTDDEELIIEVHFDKTQFNAVEELEELVESEQDTDDEGNEQD